MWERIQSPNCCVISNVRRQAYDRQQACHPSMDLLSISCHLGEKNCFFLLRKKFWKGYGKNLFPQTCYNEVWLKCWLAMVVCQSVTLDLGRWKQKGQEFRDSPEQHKKLLNQKTGLRFIRHCIEQNSLEFWKTKMQLLLPHLSSQSLSYLSSLTPLSFLALSPPISSRIKISATYPSMCLSPIICLSDFFHQTFVIWTPEVNTLRKGWFILTHSFQSFNPSW